MNINLSEFYWDGLKKNKYRNMIQKCKHTSVIRCPFTRTGSRRRSFSSWFGWISSAALRNISLKASWYCTSAAICWLLLRASDRSCWILLIPNIWWCSTSADNCVTDGDIIFCFVWLTSRREGDMDTERLRDSVTALETATSSVVVGVPMREGRPLLKRFFLPEEGELPAVWIFAVETLVGRVLEEEDHDEIMYSWFAIIFVSLPSSGWMYLLLSVQYYHILFGKRQMPIIFAFRTCTLHLGFKGCTYLII